MTRPGHGVVMLLLAATLQWAAGCASAQTTAQRALTATAVGVAAADVRIAPRLTAAADEAREISTSWDEYDHAMRKWERVNRALMATRASLLTLQLALDAWAAGDESGWKAALPCAGAALAELASAMSVAGVPVPEQLSAGIRAVGALVGGQCEGGE